MRTLNPTALFRKTRDWLTRSLVQQVPEELAVCEFGCRKTECKMEKWTHCHYRLQGGMIPEESEHDSQNDTVTAKESGKRETPERSE